MRAPRFLRWYRLLPIIAVLGFGGVSWAYSFAPAPLFQFFYPLRYEDDILASANAYGLDPYLVCAVIETESGWNPRASSDRGAEGLMQLLPETAEDMITQGMVSSDEADPDDLYDPATNIRFGCAYLSYLIEYFNGATDHAIAAYNAGMGNVDVWTGSGGELSDSIAFPETQSYLARVKTAHERYRELYPTSFL